MVFILETISCVPLKKMNQTAPMAMTSIICVATALYPRRVTTRARTSATSTAATPSTLGCGMLLPLETTNVITSPTISMNMKNVMPTSNFTCCCSRNEPVTVTMQEITENFTQHESPPAGHLIFHYCHNYRRSAGSFQGLFAAIGKIMRGIMLCCRYYRDNIRDNAGRDVISLYSRNALSVSCGHKTRPPGK